MSQKPACLRVSAELILNAADFERIDEMSIEDLKHKIFEITSTTAPVSIRVGSKLMNGKVRFVTPNPLELKEARLKSLGDSRNP